MADKSVYVPVDAIGSCHKQTDVDIDVELFGSGAEKEIVQVAVPPSTPPPQAAQPTDVLTLLLKQNNLLVQQNRALLEQNQVLVEQLSRANGGIIFAGEGSEERRRSIVVNAAENSTVGLTIMDAGQNGTNTLVAQGLAVVGDTNRILNVPVCQPAQPDHTDQL